uniref:SP-RING-type domain-containing protein n=1 Tax=Strongyloides papillosus TaxID=174720 RepID=A0A0N5BI96_STREA
MANSQDHNIFTNELAIKKCWDLILKKFRTVDLYSCLKRINHKPSGTKSQLRRILSDIFELHTDDEELVKIILDRGDILDCYLETGIEIDDVRIIPTLDIGYFSSYIERKNIFTMRRLYFYKDIQKIGGWSCVTIRSIDYRMSLEFKVATNLFNGLFLEAGSGMPPQTTFLLRCARINDDDRAINALKDDYPVGMKLFINEVDFTSLLPREIFYNNIDRRERLSSPTVLNKGIIECQEDCEQSDYLNIRVEFARARNKNNTYAIGVFSSTQGSVEDLCNEILSRERITIDEFKKDFVKFMPKQRGIELDCTKINLLSSATYVRIRIPFRGRNCNHIIPDDLEDYLTINRGNEKWLCKICKNLCTPDDIMIDEFFEKILNNHPDDEEIFLYSGERLMYKLGDGIEMYIDDLLEKKDDKEISDDNVGVVEGDEKVVNDK